MSSQTNRLLAKFAIAGKKSGDVLGQVRCKNLEENLVLSQPALESRKQSTTSHLRLIYLLLLTLFLLFSFVCNASENGWQQLSPGIEYQDLEGGLLTPWSHIHVFRVDLNHNQLALINARALALKNASTGQFAAHAKALLSINGGFFDPEFKPLGLRINNKKLENPLKQISWWGIFYVKNNKPYISNIRHFIQDNEIEFAIQSGPRLLIKGRIPSLKPGIADRSALGITQNGKVIFLVTTNAAMTTHELAQILKTPPLSCTDAINLDGGSSSQLSAHINSFKLSVHGFSNISDAIVVKKLHNAATK